MKKEKYIVLSKDNKYVTVKFTYKYNGMSRTYTKTFTVSNFDSFEDCYNAAIEHRDIKRAEMLVSGAPSGTKRTVGQLLEDYFRIDRVTLGNKEVLLARYNKYIKPYYHNRDITKITPLDIQQNLNSMIYEATDNTISRVHTVWKHIISTARLLDVISVNPLERVKVPQSRISTEKRSQTVSDEDLEKILQYFFATGRSDNDRYDNTMIANFMIVMMETGMRPAEISALQRLNIDFTHNVIKVRQSFRSTDKERLALGRTKTESSVRDVPMTTQCQLIMKNVMNNSKSDTFLFVDHNGEVFTTKRISQHVNTVKKRLGIDFHLYMLRHRFSTNLVTNNVDPRTVMELMGHKNFGMTVSYARSDDEKKKNAIEENIKSVDLSTLN